MRGICGLWQGKKASNPRPTVLETAALPAELFPYKWWTVRDSNPGPTGYEPAALPTELAVHKCPCTVSGRRRKGSGLTVVAPPVGLEPTTLRLTAACSTD